MSEIMKFYKETKDYVFQPYESYLVFIVIYSDHETYWRIVVYGRSPYILELEISDEVSFNRELIYLLEVSCISQNDLQDRDYKEGNKICSLKF